MTAPAIRRKHMLESDWQVQVIDLASRLGWRHMHPERVTVQRPDGRVYAQTPLSGGLGPGWPDLTLARDRIVFVELKSGRGHLRQEQREVLEALRTAGGEVYVWTPRDLDEAQRVLSARRRP